MVKLATDLVNLIRNYLNNTKEDNILLFNLVIREITVNSNCHKLHNRLSEILTDDFYYYISYYQVVINNTRLILLIINCLYASPYVELTLINLQHHH